VTSSFDARTGAREALWASAGLLAVLTAGKHLAGVLPRGNDVVYVAAAAFQILVPLWLIQRRGEAPESHRIHCHGLLLGPVAALRAVLVRGRRRRRSKGRPGPFAKLLARYGVGARLRPRPLVDDLGRALLTALVVFAPIVVTRPYWARAFELFGLKMIFAHELPSTSAMLTTLATNVFLVALPEELFYRGFVETRLERLWPTRLTVLFIPLSRTVFLTSLFFALGHFLGEYNPVRLGPFFPAFLFSMLARRGQSIGGAVLFHGLANTFSAALFAGVARA
jgi:membrane protease YdiL (CAAX protease family)